MRFRGSPALPALVLMTLLLPACWARKHVREKTETPAAEQTAAADQTPAAADTEAGEEPTPEPTVAPPSVTVHITYARRDDYLESLAVAKFASATLLPTHAKAGAAVIRFEGGEPVWEIAADRGVSGSLLGHMPGVQENKKFALTEVTYGVVPRNFSKQQPENSEPEPLEPGKYYIFTVRRASGSIGYQAVHISADGSAEGYEAQPRAGTSYQLCCDVTPGFASPAQSDSGP